MALNLEKVFSPGVRQHRDIDLLVKKEDIGRAYKILRKLKFRYDNPETSDNADFLLKHHLPPMRNEFGILLELHWRITDVNSFKKCPLTDSFFENKKESKFMNGVFIPNLNCLIAHTIYHGIKHHKYNHGPIFLFDLSAIYRFNANKWPENTILIEKLGLQIEFEKCKKIILATHRVNKFSNEVRDLIKEILSGFDWKIEKKKKIKISSFYNKNKSLIEIIKKPFLEKLSITSHLYQLPKNSFKYWFYFLRDLSKSLKKISF